MLLYLPCESFAVNDSGENKLKITAGFENGEYFANAELTVADKKAEAYLKSPKDDSKKLQIKNLIGKTFLEAAEKVFGYKSPWGIFTGIRPAKIASDYLISNSAEDTKRILCDEYMFLPQKAVQASTLLLTEKTIFSIDTYPSLFS